MHILFFMRNVGYVRNFETVMRRLAGRGHSVTVVFDTRKVTATEEPVIRHLDVITAECPNISFEELLPPRSELLPIAARYLRLGQDYLRYLDPVYAQAGKLRARAEEPVPTPLRRVLGAVGGFSMGRAAATRLLGGLDSLIPVPDYLIEFLRERNPDLVLVTPLLGLGSAQADYVKAARHLGIRTALPVASWDNLTNKGLVRFRPDRVFVWNEPQREEAITLHGIASDKVIATGAHTYDHWFDWSPSTSREEFGLRVGIDPQKPYVLFLGSSPFISPKEPEFVRKWLAALRQANDPAVRDVGVVIRPHPQNYKLWTDTDVSEFGPVAVWPRGGANPVGREAKSGYYDSIYHSRLVVGVNTSAMIEAGILGKSVYTVLSEDHADTQDGTLHFKHLSDAEGGLVVAARDFAEHNAQLATALAAPDDSDERSRRFVSRFVRPFGREDGAAERFVAAVEAQLADPAPAPREPGLAKRSVAVVASPLLLFCLPEQRRRQHRAKKNPERGIKRERRMKRLGTK